MSQTTNNIGFVLPNVAHLPASLAFKSNPTGHGHQPFPGPIQHQVVSSGPAPPSSWLQMGEFANYLVGASSFQVKQKVELLEVLVGLETENKYVIKDERGNKIFYAGEISDCLSRNCLRKSRPFTMTIRDARSGVEVLNFNRPIDCSCCCGAFCSDSVDVYAGNGVKLGSVQSQFSILRPLFKIKDASGKTVLRIQGPYCPCSCFGGPVLFNIMTKNGAPVGKVAKTWGGFVREFVTDADTFGITFPADLDAAIKAVCLAALFLIDYQYFEDGPKSRAFRI